MGVIDRNILKSYLDTKLGEGKYTLQGLKYDCPLCAEDGVGKANLEINITKKVFKCWADGYKGSIRKLLKEHANSESWRQLKEFRTDKKDFEVVEKVKSVELPLCIPFYLSEQVSDYLINERHIDEKLLIERKIMYCYSKEEELYNNIIFPFYEEGNLIGFSSQNFDTKKYKNHRDLNFVPYKDLINENFPITITEGQYDSYSVPNAIPTLGTTISKEIYKYCKDKNVIIAFDCEIPLDKKMYFLSQFMFYGAKDVIVFNLKEYKDLNEYRQKDLDGLKKEYKLIYDRFI